MRKTDQATTALSPKPLAIAVALALGAPGALLAEPMLQVPLTRGADMTRYDSNYLELGAGYTSGGGDLYNFGEYDGLYKDGGFLIGNANVRKRLGGEGLGYVNAWAYNFGLPTFQLGAEGGSQGLYWANIGYDQLKRAQYDDTKFIFNGLGSSRLTVKPGSVPAAGIVQPPASAAQITGFEEFDIKQERDIFRLGGGFYLGPDWKISVNYRQDNRDGSKLIGSVMGSNGGNPRSVIIPYDLNDQTQQIEVKADWTGKQGQLNLSYWYSKYTNDAPSLTWQNPYALVAGTLNGVQYPTGYGRLGLMPDNDFHQFQATGGWNFTPNTRLTGTLAYSIMKQNDSFLPYTINTPAVTGTANIATPIALPRNSLNGEVKNTLFDLSFLTRPITPLSLKLNYQYRKHENDTPSDVYNYVGGDVAAQPAVGANSGAIRRNLPPGTEENKFRVDGDYRLAKQTMLRGWYQYSKINYEEAVDELRTSTTNNLAGAELRRVMSEVWTGALRYVYDQRRGTDFSVTRPYVASYSAATVAASPVDNVTTLRQFFMADYDKNLIGATATITPLEQVTLGLRADYYKVNYKGPDCGGSTDQTLLTQPPAVPPNFPVQAFPAECLGRTNANGQSYTIDGSWMPAEGWNVFAFYTYQQYGTDQASRSWGGANFPQNANRDWKAKLDYDDNTFGLGINFKPADKKFDVGAQYIYSDGVGSYSTSVASVSNVAAQGLPAPVSIPDTKTRLNSFQLYAKYQYSKNLLFRANYWYQSFKSNDWAYDNATMTSSNNVLLTGHQSPNYHANVFGFSVAYTGW